MEVLEGQNILVTISGKKNKIRVYYLSWLNNKIFKKDQVRDFSVPAHHKLLLIRVWRFTFSMSPFNCDILQYLFFFSRMIEEMAG